MRRRRLILAVVYSVLAGAFATLGTLLWIRFTAAGHTHEVADAPVADVAIVFGAQVAPGGTEPMPVLANRLKAGAELIRSGKAKVLLVSGDAAGTSGNETEVMTNYLTAELGVPADRIVMDPYGLDTYETCVRAAKVYGISRALLVTQDFHLYRAVALCRNVDIDAEGVFATCDDCRTVTVARNTARDWIASPKAAWEALWEADPSVASPPDPAVRDAVAKFTG